MSIVYKMLPDGGFLAGDTETRRTCYAYPESPYARFAVKSPESTAIEMMTEENKYRRRDLPYCREVDDIRWKKLEGKTQ